jgi:membrane-bound lytic murein transglycosylase A
LVPAEWRDLGSWSDDMDFAGLELACEGSLGYYGRLRNSKIPLSFGGASVSVADYLEGLEAFRDILRRPSLSAPEKRKRIQKEFALFRSAGRDGKGDVLFTGYYEPWLVARRQPDGNFCFPIYARPSDLLTIDLSAYALAKSDALICGRLDGTRVLPYYTREEIDGRKVLAGKGLELLWLEDPVDVFFLQVQGSGMVTLENGEKVRVQYDGKNCHPYVSLGRHLIDKGYLQKGQASMPKIRAFLAGHPEERQALLNANPSYTFFRLEKDGPFGNIGVALTPWRSIASDARLFPKGALALIRTEKPVLDSKGAVTGWVPFTRFVMNQDTGGAIVGPGRVDLFCGGGPQAEVTAGNMQQRGELYFLLKKR